VTSGRWAAPWSLLSVHVDELHVPTTELGAAASTDGAYSVLTGVLKGPKHVPEWRQEVEVHSRVRCARRLVPRRSRGCSWVMIRANLLLGFGVTKSHSRPRVSNDSPYSEEQFKTMRFRPDYPDGACPWG
jgi:hypothetical protein